MKRKIVFWVATVFLSAVASLAFAQNQEEVMVEHPMMQGRQLPQDKKDMDLTLLNKFTRELNLTTDQQAQVKLILEKSMEETKAIFESTQGQIRKVKEESNENIKALLNEEQKAKFEDLIQRMRQERMRAETMRQGPQENN